MHIEQSDFHDQLVRGLTHKMNNILSLFHGYLGLIIEGKKLDRETREGLDAIREGAHVASELMDRTKAFATPSSTVWRQIEIGDFMRMLMPSLESFAENGVTVKFSCEEKLPGLCVDTSRLRSAVVELVRNACEASLAGGVVEIAAHRESHQPRGKAGAGASNASQPIAWVVLTVSDSGAGIAKEIAKKIFQPFFSTKQKRNAMGLGLSVALGFAQQLGGVIRFQSAAGRTAFRLMLPSRSEGY
jgi:two-component system cell cycle sensor histidine kinase/response regulator CckA